MESLLLNGNPRVTLIERFNGTAVILGPIKGERTEVASLSIAKDVIEGQNWEINIAFIKGSPIMREITDGNASIKAGKKA